MIPWNPRPADVSRFTEGDCMIFARAINKITGWPICTFDANGWDFGNYHVFVQMPDGRCVDIEGVFEPKEFIKKWKGYGVKSFSQYHHWPSFRRDWNGVAFGAYSYERANVMARRLLYHYGLMPS
jgi:hypothetical protein